MAVWLRYAFVAAYVLCFTFVCDAARKTIYTIERPVIKYWNPNYISYINMTSSRRGRNNPVYYTSVHLKTLVNGDNNIMANDAPGHCAFTSMLENFGPYFATQAQCGLAQHTILFELFGSKVHFSIFEFSRNKNNPSLLDMHFRLCDMIEKEPLFGSPLRQRALVKPCPFAPGEYHLYNITIPDVNPVLQPFPYTRGYCVTNITHAKHMENLLLTQVNIELRDIVDQKKN